MKLEDIRYIEDDPTTLIDINLDNDSRVAESKKLLRSLYCNSVLVTNDLFPDLSKSIDKTRQIVASNLIFEVFVKPDPTPQAYCMALPERNSLVVILTSSLIELLNVSELQFVLGHELGHYFFGHYQYPNPEGALNELDYLKRVYLSRCAEISADRVGFLTSPSLDDALLGIIKVASGLSEQHIKLNVFSYINQLREVKSLKGYIDNAYSPHPIFPLRMRSLLWFSMSEPFYLFSNNSGMAPINRSQLDKMVKKDLQEISDKLFFEKENELLTNVLLWATMKLTISDKKLTEQDQTIIKEHLPPYLVDKAVNFLKSYSAKANEIIDEKLDMSLKQISGIRKSKIGELYSQLAIISKKLCVRKKTLDTLIEKLK